MADKKDNKVSVRIGNTILGFTNEKPKPVKKPVTEAEKAKAAARAHNHNVKRTEDDIKKAKSLGIKNYCIRTSGDARVCDICAKLDFNTSKKKFPVNKAVIGKNIPPLHEGCRCYAELIVNEKYYK